MVFLRENRHKIALQFNQKGELFKRFVEEM